MHSWQPPCPRLCVHLHLPLPLPLHRLLLHSCLGHGMAAVEAATEVVGEAGTTLQGTQQARRIAAAPHQVVAELLVVVVPTIGLRTCVPRGSGHELRSGRRRSTTRRSACGRPS